MDDKFGLSRRSVIAGMAGSLVALGTVNAEEVQPRLIHQDYIVAREKFRTRLLTKGPAPDMYEPLEAPADAEQISYNSSFGGDIELIAWVSKYKRDIKAKPAVLFLHGGNAMGIGHWEVMRPYIDAGFVVMMPSVRGENGQQGSFSGFYDEVEDVLAAADLLERMPGVDSNRLFIAGHSVGGTLAMLGAMSTHRFRAAAPISGNADAFRFFDRYPQDIRFDDDNPHEFEVRSALCYARSFKCPIHICHGSEEKHFDARNALLVKRARAGGVYVEHSVVPGTHTTAIPGAIEQSIRFFKSVAA